MTQIKESQPLEPPRPDIRQPDIYQDLRNQHREPFLIRLGTIVDQAGKSEDNVNDGNTNEDKGEIFENSEIVLLFIPSVDGSPTKPFEIPLSEAAEIARVGRLLSQNPSQP